LTINQILEQLKFKIESEYPLIDRYSVSNGNQNGFEILVCDKLTEIINSNDTLQFIAHMGHHFPDIDIIIDNKIYGLELKSRSNGSWTTNGNSVFESISNNNYEDIFILFGTQIENKFSVRYKYYWEVTEDILVTHSPRFKINMNAQVSVFESKESYNAFKIQSDESKGEFLQSYLSENSQGNKWYLSNKKKSLPFLLKNLSPKKRKNLIAEIFVLFPYDLLIPSKNAQYDNTAIYLISTYYTCTPNLRDVFSAGGTIESRFLKGKIQRRYKVFSDHATEIKLFCNQCPADKKEFIYSQWAKDIPHVKLNNENLFDDYITILNSISLHGEICRADDNAIHLSDFILANQF